MPLLFLIIVRLTKMNKRGFTVAQTVVTLVVLSIVILALVTLVSRVKTEQSRISGMKTVFTCNVNTIERLSKELETTGTLKLGETSTTVTYGFKPVVQTVTIAGSAEDHTYLVTVKSRVRGQTTSTSTSKVILSVGTLYE